MRQLLRSVCYPLLNIFERGDEDFVHRPMNRKILIVVSTMFSILASAIILFAPKDDLGFLIPVVIFYGVGFTGLIISFLGTDRAVAKIWGGK